MELKDYIQYYLHCDFYLINRQIKTRITNYWPMQDKEHCVGYGLDGDNGVEDIKYTKPILRKLEDITHDEIKELIAYDKAVKIYDYIRYRKHLGGITVSYGVETDDGGVHPQTYEISFLSFTTHDFNFFTKNGFDLFRLIDNDLALDSKTLK